MTPEERADRDSYNLQRIADLLVASHQLSTQRDWRDQEKDRTKEIRDNQIRVQALAQLERRARAARGAFYGLAAAAVTFAVTGLVGWLS